MSGNICCLIFFRIICFAGMTVFCSSLANDLPFKGPLPHTRPGISLKTSPSFMDRKNTPVSNIIRSNDNIPSRAFRSALESLHNGRLEDALAIRDKIPPDTIERNTLTWAIAVSDRQEIPEQQFQKAMIELKKWPGKHIIQTRFERALARNTHPPKKIIALFSHTLPKTADGMAILGEALILNGEKARARAVIAPWWHGVKLDKREELLVVDKVGSILTKNDYQIRLKRMLYAYRLNSAERIAQLADATSLYTGFAAVARGKPDASQKLDAVRSFWKKQPIYLFAKIQHLRRTGKYEQAAQLILKVAGHTNSLTDPDVWWIEQRVLSREMLDIGKPELAYQLAATYMAKSPAMVIDAEFHAGWYALRFLKKAETAMQHFSRIPKLSSRTVSAARGFYWMGRAAEGMQKKDKAHICFQQAAHYNTTFYGQLAASRLNRRKSDIPYPRPTTEDRNRFETYEPVKAIRLLEATESFREARMLYLEVSKQLETPGEMALLAIMAEHHDDYHTSVKIGKKAVLRGFSAGALSHPLGAVPTLVNISVQKKALIYAIARQESEFNSTAISGANARGMLQLLPEAAKEIAARKGLSYSVQKLSGDPAYNATLGAYFLDERLNAFDKSYILALIAYNAGPRRASEWIKRYGDPRGRPVDEVIDWIERIPYTETRNYVQRVMENYEVYKTRMTGASDIREDLVLGHRTNNE